MTKERTIGPTEDYEQGYADGMRDAAAWSAKRAADLCTFARVLSGEIERMATAVARIETDARQFEDAAQSRWAQWSDRRNWPDVQDLVAQHRAGTPAAVPARRSKAARPAREKVPADPLPTLSLSGAAIAPPEDGGLSEEQDLKRAAGQAWRA